MNRWLTAGLPLAIFALIAWFLLQGLGRNPRDIPSPLINRPAPLAALEALQPLEHYLAVARPVPAPAHYPGKVWMLNVWGSWCSGCQIEHPLLNALAAEGLLPIVGLAWKDSPAQASQWLERLGNPYSRVLMDLDGKAAIEWGVYGAPETFVIDAQGMVRFKHVGPLSEELIRTQLRPLLARLASS